MSAPQLQGWAGRTVRVPKHDAKGEVISYRPTETGVLLNIQTATGEWLPNIPAAEVEPEAPDAPVDVQATAPAAEAWDLSDLAPETLALGTLTALDRGSRIDPKAVRRLATIVLRRHRRAA